MISKYWKMLEWLATHKMGYLAALIYTTVGILALLPAIILMGIVEITDRGVVEVFTSTLKSFIKGGKI